MRDGARRGSSLEGAIRTWLVVSALLVIGLSPRSALAEPPPIRKATLEWDEAGDVLQLSISYRDALDARTRRKLSRGLPTTIVLTGTAYRQGVSKPVSTTVQSCKITWHVWNEAYRVEITRPDASVTRWTTTLEGVLRRCAEARDLPVAVGSQLPSTAAVHLLGKIQVNPISPEVLEKIRRWVTRPVRTGTAAPGDALFSTFTGLFMQRVGDAESTVEFRTTPVVPKVKAAPPKQEERRRNEG